MNRADNTSASIPRSIATLARARAVPSHAPARPSGGRGPSERKRVVPLAHRGGGAGAVSRPTGAGGGGGRAKEEHLGCPAPALGDHAHRRGGEGGGAPPGVDTADGPRVKPDVTEH